MTTSLYEQVAAKLKHPFHGRRRTDPQLAQAALTGHLGMRREAARAQREVPISGAGTLTDAAWNLPKRSGFGALLEHMYRTWYLRRLMQVDQGQTPWCVDACRCHWQLSLPVYGKLTHPLGNLYAECKKIDPWPNEDGTSSEYMLEVCQSLGIVKSTWWYTGPQDADSALQWLTERSGLWLGAMWPESAFRTDADGIIHVADGDQWQYGHETYLIGRNPNYKRQGPHIQGVQSWGIENYGVRGRFWIPEKLFFDQWMNADMGWGDLVGVEEQVAA
jgi:hypothetical protein